MLHPYARSTLARGLERSLEHADMEEPPSNRCTHITSTIIPKGTPLLLKAEKNSYRPNLLMPHLTILMSPYGIAILSEPIVSTALVAIDLVNVSPRHLSR